MSMVSPQLQIGAAPPQRQAETLRLLFNHLSPTEQTALVRSLLAGAPGDDLPMLGLLEARRGERLVGAVWAQVQPGATAVVWPPKLVDDEPDSSGTALMKAAVDFLSSREICMAQALVDRNTQAGVTWLEKAGFAHFAELLYLVCHEDYFPASQPDGKLEFEQYTSGSRTRLADVVVRTYEETLDCPKLNGVRDMDDVLAGYQETGVFDPERWLLVRHEGRDVGCLLMADHPGPGHLELVYMGLVPEARGNGFGIEIARRAQWMTAQSGRRRLVLAVDAGNRYALAMYTSVGFASWEQRSVYLRVFES